MDQKAIENFKALLNVRTVSNEGSRGAYAECVRLLERLLHEAGVQETSILEFVPGKPILLATFRGSDEGLPSILLNSHYDVVPAYATEWNTDPFQATELENGDIVARGTQDMKSVCIQYIEAIHRLIGRRGGKPFRRTIHLTFVPDEEIGGVDGMGKLVQTGEIIRKLHIGLALDEGIASTTDKFTLFYGERVPWWITVRATGPTGHGSRFIKNTAMEKLIRTVNRFLEFRAEQERLLDEHGCKHAAAKKLGDVITLNLTVLRGGVETEDPRTGERKYALNVVPAEAEAGFDLRIPPTVALCEFEEKLKEWTSREEGVSYRFAVTKTPVHAVTSLDESVNPWWKVFREACEKIGVQLEPEIFPAATDSRYLRQLGVPAFGFSPMNNTPVLLHDHNERLHRDVFLRGIAIYEHLIEELAEEATIQ